MKPFRFFYGWWIVVALFLISFYSAGVIFYSFTAVLEPIVLEFGWSYAQVSWAASIRGFETSLFAPVVGYIIDRYGPRKLIFIGGVIITIGLLLLSRINSVIGLYGAFFVVAMGLSACTGVILTTVVGNWFKKKMSIATGIAVCGTATGGLLVPLVTYLVDTLEWRTAMVVFAVTAFVWILPLSLLVRHKPEQYGYLPDGDVMPEQPPAEAPTLPHLDDTNIGIGQALKSRVFWHLALGFMCHLLVVTSVLTHIMPFLSSVGIPRSTSSFVASGVPLISVLGRLSFGWSGDRFDRRRLTAVGLFITGLGLLMLFMVDSSNSFLLILFVILFGFGFGGPVPMTPPMLQAYYGRARLGTIMGLCMGVMMVGMMLGPPLAGWIYDTSGSYQNAWLTFMGVLALGMILMLNTPSVEKYRSSINR